MAAEGGKSQDIVKLTTFVTKLSDWYPPSEEQQATFAQYFEGENLANPLVEVSALATRGLDIEIEAIALLD